jgi:hypothetical protein
VILIDVENGGLNKWLLEGKYRKLAAVERMKGIDGEERRAVTADTRENSEAGG